jgi:membrane fusion protein (multidrug efflux system)
MLAMVALVSAGCAKKEQAAPPPPPDVEVVQVEQKDVPITREWVATLDGFVNAQVTAQVTGYLVKQLYSNGDFVKKGQPLFQIDDRPFKAALEQAQGTLEQAQGNLSVANSNLQTWMARLGKTELDVARYTPLAAESAISKQELDDAVQANLAAKAQVESAKAAIQAAKANVDSCKAAVANAQLNLGFTTVDSPIDGVAGIATIQVGNLVGPQTGALTTVSTVNPILANFTPSEQEYLAASRFSGESESREEATLRTLQFTLILADGTTYPYKGRLYAMNRQVDIRTGAILLQAEFPNPGNVLRPGGFARISTVARIQKGALLLPQRAVSELQGNYQVAVVGEDNKVSIRTVKAGAKIGSMWIIDEGLKPGERVVADGVQKVREGMQVNPKPYQPASEGK